MHKNTLFAAPNAGTATPAEAAHQYDSVEALHSALARGGYFADDRTAMALFLAHHLQKPLLIEGPPGVGKTELAKAAAGLLESPLIRLQCYRGLDESKTLYEWKYGKQLLYSQILKQQVDRILDHETTLNQAIGRLHELDDVFFSEQFVEPRPLLKALQQPEGAVLLIDEVDKSDEEFEALLLEVLSDYQVTIPELGTIQARHIPLVILTSNQQRELGDALKRRCLHLSIPFPSLEQELQIVRQKVPGIQHRLSAQLAAFVHKLRQLPLLKQPAISETLDWARALLYLHADSLSPEQVTATLNVLLKRQEDIDYVEPRVKELLPDERV